MMPNSAVLKLLTGKFDLVQFRQGTASPWPIAGLAPVQFPWQAQGFGAVSLSTEMPTLQYEQKRKTGFAVLNKFSNIWLAHSFVPGGSSRDADKVCISASSLSSAIRSLAFQQCD